MAQLKIYKNNELKHDVQLDPSRTYLIGRGESCEVRLDPEPGISRQHLRISFLDQRWTVECLSRYGELYIGGEKKSSFTLQEGKPFTVPPFEFLFSEESPVIEAHSAAVKSVASPLPTESNDGSELPQPMISDKTVVSQLPSQPFLKMIDLSGQIIQVYKLEGDAWQAGRDPSCSVFIDNHQVSRKQFEIYREGTDYFVRDLGSSNGTLLNAKELSTEDWSPLVSADLISVADLTFQFELRDEYFEQRLQEVNTGLKAPMPFQPPTSDMPPPIGGDFPIAFDQNLPVFGGGAPVPGGPGFYDPNLSPDGFQQQPPPQFGFIQDEAPEPLSKWQQFRAKLTPIRMVILILLLVGVGYGILELMGPSEQDKKRAEKLKTPFEQLKPEDQQQVEQAYMLAYQFFTTGKYENALQELAKVHVKLPKGYKESKDIEKLSKSGIEALEAQRKKEQEDREKAEIEEKIQKQVAECRKIITPKTDLQELDGCLAPIIAFNPEHPEIVKLKTEVEKLVMDRQLKQTQRKEYLEKVKKLTELFNKAVELHKQKKRHEAIAAYDKVIVTTLPDPKNYKGQSKSRKEAIQSQMAREQAEAERRADALQREGKLKEAVLEIKKALAINPENEVIKGRLQMLITELRRQMQNYYQEAIVEESVGEVEAAKVKWKKIMDLSVPEEDYYNKSKIKLKKYGAI